MQAIRQWRIRRGWERSAGVGDPGVGVAVVAVRHLDQVLLVAEVMAAHKATRTRYRPGMMAYIKSVTFDCAEPLRVAAFWAAALGSDVDEDSTSDRAWVEPAGWGGPTLWFVRVPEQKVAKNRQHFDLRALDGVRSEVQRLTTLGAAVLRDDGELVVMADPEGNEFCVE